MATLGDLALKSKVKFGNIYGKPIIWIVADKNHSGYPANSVTLVTNQTIKFMPFDVPEPNSVGGGYSRRSYGNNRYAYSNIRQWLNSAAAAGAWYTAKHSYDAPPSSSVTKNSYQDAAGFLNAFSANDRSVLLSTTLHVPKCTYDGGGTDTCVDQIFLLSHTELGIKLDPFKDPPADDGVLLPIFGSDNNARIATATAASVQNAEYTGNVEANEGSFYFTRSIGNTENVYHLVAVRNNGSAYENAYPNTSNYTLRAACNVQKTVTISSTTDSDGCYTIVYNTPPVISGSNGALGTFGENIPSYKYTVTDAQGGTVSVTETLDGKVLRTYNASLGAQNTLTFSATEWRKVLNGNHTLLITATDSAKAKATRQQTFVKKVTSCAFSTTSAFSSSATMPTRCIVNVQGSFPAGSTLTVEICNNGNDASPTWENITSQALNNQKYFFTNKTKTASQWGVKVRASLSRGTASGDCYISSIGGNFQ